jgi:hypothetical protein
MTKISYDIKTSQEWQTETILTKENENVIKCKLENWEKKRINTQDSCTKGNDLTEKSWT